MPNNSHFITLKKKIINIRPIKVDYKWRARQIDEDFWCAIARIWQWRHPAILAVCRLYPTYSYEKPWAILLFHSQMSNFVDCWLLLKSFCCLLGNFILLCNSLFTAKYFHTYFLAWNRWDEHLHLLNIYCVLELLLWPIQRKANFV